jgi:serine/threonine protein kinase
MAPEVLDKASGTWYDAKKADIYSLGITLFVLLIGEFPNPHELFSNSSTDDSEK